ncbi:MULTISPECIES: N-acetylmannosamine-6-phosphate 2-epimerase [Clostridium]|jgi:N-acylglucosamine-6-phosphate 2-epimerase|uniref:Putative N-acetylmannosamine-6-phosphate 2-epimerase n=1 Tax=Clostridium butyricum TaxID=1492 RepID=A0AAP9RC56_CLOBU|nr:MULTISPECIES: N-acetylmannosamine-6-phosphate 2-epimerase [Clostridium]ALP91475.1 N-acetylmannosamine-6-phosphate 2-epimerase [Clostridium butyricum]ALS17971.1 N-acetylmannosamine-6-phosphate 2-epimerase [Clostridium butyricum]ANF15095.1 N-acetylmannosamine-6-phosphate 2-epimerase [Clostridium butyricum]AOR95106.1 N-acetylmannosamine-6-phosphate 2-epimerase [Clostridium butyricum]EMU55666.1 putative N-acetylmannosamine-6-phosphate epimerase [Clostridium butyricum DKU-01]
MDKEKLLKEIKGKLIVSCQALEGEPLYIENSSIMPLMARAAKQAGAAAIRTNGVRDVIGIKEETNLPIIGIIKKGYEGYEQYITVTMDEIDQLVQAGADIIAMDCTLRERVDGRSVSEFIQAIKEKYPQIILMADISNLEEGINAWKAGIDMVGTTLSGYTEYTLKLEEPDFKLIEDLAKNIDIPIIAEGRIHRPEQATKALDLGAHAVVVGGAITRPLEIATRFVDAISKR